MEKLTVVHCADLHIGAPLAFLGEKAASRRAEYLQTFERIITLCKNREADVLLIAGDLFDSPSPDKQYADRVIELIASIPDTTVVLSAGNHDPLCADSPYRQRSLPPNMHVFSDKVGMIEIKDKNTRIYGISFVSSSFSSHLRIPTADDDAINIFLLHGDLDADVNSRYNPVSKANIAASRMDYVALGHIHKRTEIMREGSTYFAYSGCPEGSGFDETGEKGVYVGTIEKGSVKMEFMPLCLRRFEEANVNITGKESSQQVVDFVTEQLKEKFGENYTENFYKIILTGKTEEPFVPDLNYIQSSLAPKLYFVKLKCTATFDIDYEMLAREFTLKGIFAKKMLEKIKNANEAQRARLENALRLGLMAFDTEVKPDEA